MKKRGIVIMLTAALAMGMLVGCGTDSSSADTNAETATEAAEEATEETQEQGEVADAADQVEDMQSRVEDDMEDDEVTEEEILTMVQNAVSCSADPCANDSVTEMAAYTGEYLYTLGKDKASDHVLTTLGEKLYNYTTLIAVDGADPFSDEAEAALEEIDSLISENLADDAAMESQAASFYELVK